MNEMKKYNDGSIKLMLETYEETKNDASEIISRGHMSLGCANGWDREFSQFYRDLMRFKKEYLGTQKLGRCYNRDAYLLNDGETALTISFETDSGD